jgi:hypothetical protein
MMGNWNNSSNGGHRLPLEMHDDRTFEWKIASVVALDMILNDLFILILIKCLDTLVDLRTKPSFFIN